MSVSLMIFIFVVVALSFIIKGLVGFGDPLVFNPILTTRMDNKVISPGMLPVAVILNSVIAYRNRKEIHVRTVMPIIVCMLPGIIAGTLLLKVGAPWVLKVFLGIVIVFQGVEMLTRAHSKKEAKSNIVAQSILSFLSGMTAGLFGINLLFLVYLERTAKNRGEFRGSVCLVFLVENVFRVFVYLANGIFTKSTLIFTALSLPAALIGMWVGGQIDKRMGEKSIRRLIIYVFIIGGISTFVRALIARA